MSRHIDRPLTSVLRLALMLGLLAMVAAIGSIGPGAPTVAYERFSENDDATNCRFCHGDFRSSSYTSLSDGQNWGNLHDLHRTTMLSNDCFACHINGDTFPVIIGAADGGNGLAPLGCVGCHGRAEDGTGTGTEGYGLAMQRRHTVLNVGVDQNGATCTTCHANAAPGGPTPVGEDVLPPFYANPGINHPNIPTDPCNPPPALTEDFAGATFGIDNDGDTIADQNDLDCVASTPGEASSEALAPLLVTGHDRNAGTIEVGYAAACGSSDNALRYGLLDSVASYAYTGAECSILNTSSYTWSYPTASDSLFFLIVGNDGSVEGSYGLGAGGAERPSDGVSLACSLTQDLGARCD